MNIRNKRTLITAIVGLVAVAVAYFSGCEGTTNEVSEGSQIDTTYVVPDIADQNKEHLLEEANNILSLKNEDLRIKLFKTNKTLGICLANEIKPTIVVIDTCIIDVNPDIDEATKEQLLRKSEIIANYEKQIEAQAKYIDELETGFYAIESQLSDLSSSSPYFSEKATVSKDEDGKYSILFQKVQPLMPEVEEIISEAFQPSTSDYYKYSFLAGWGLNTDLHDFSNIYQNYTAGFVYRPKQRFGVGLVGTYSSRNVQKYAPVYDQLQVSALIQYNFNK